VTGPWQSEGEWLKTALHLHSIESDGTASPTDLVGAYSLAGFDVVAITEHWKVTKEPSTASTLVIQGAELAVDPMAEGRYSEILAIGIEEIPEDPGGDKRFWEPIDNYLFKTFPDYTTAAACINDQGGVAFMCHPYWSGHTPDILYAAEGLAGIELFNAGAERDNGRGDSSYLWDLALERGMPLSGIATDDTHYPEVDIGAGWTMVRAAERTQAAVVEALRSGEFYASAGPSLLHVERDGGHVEVSCSPCFSVQVHTNWERGWYVRADDRNQQSAIEGEAELGSRALETTEDGSITRAEFDMSDPGITYYRIVLTDAAGQKAWSNLI
jgi:hypothetical protein